MNKPRINNHFLRSKHPRREKSRQNVVSETSAASCWGASLQDAVSNKPSFASAPLRHKGTYFSLIFLSFSTRQATWTRTQRSKKKKRKKSCLVLGEGRLSVNARGNFSRDALAPSNKNSECCLCQAETSGHLITDKWGLVLASVRINPFCKHSYPNLLNMSFRNCTKSRILFLRFFKASARPDRDARERWKMGGCHNLHLAGKLFPAPSVAPPSNPA